jgi:hypothetical protein
LHGKLLRIVGALNGAHIFGTLVPVEEPSTASIADIGLYSRSFLKAASTRRAREAAKEVKPSATVA